MSLRQARQLGEVLMERGLRWNAAWDGREVAVDADGPPPSSELPGGLRITVLSPAHLALRDLAVEAARRQPDAPRSFEQKAPNAVDTDLPSGGSDEPPGVPLIKTEEAPGSGETGSGETETDPRTATAAEPAVLYLSHFDGDASWASRVLEALLPLLDGDRIEVVSTASIYSGLDSPEVAAEESIDRAVAGVVLVSSDYVESGWNIDYELMPLTDRAANRQLTLSWILIDDARWQETKLIEWHTGLEFDTPLSAFGTDEIGEVIDVIARRLATMAAVAADEARSSELDVDALAERPFTPDASLANASSIAFLAEYGDNAVLIGGDAGSGTLVESIRALLAERDGSRLAIDAFVVPHGGSDHNLSTELLDLLACDRFLVSTDGARFGHPGRETIARIVKYGRNGPQGRPTIVFNYRTATNAEWGDPGLMRRFDYDVVYPDDEPGITVHLH